MFSQRQPELLKCVPQKLGVVTGAISYPLWKGWNMSCCRSQEQVVTARRGHGIWARTEQRNFCQVHTLILPRQQLEMWRHDLKWRADIITQASGRSQESRCPSFSLLTTTKGALSLFPSLQRALSSSGALCPGPVPFVCLSTSVVAPRYALPSFSVQHQPMEARGLSTSTQLSYLFLSNLS